MTVKVKAVVVAAVVAVDDCQGKGSCGGGPLRLLSQ